MARKLIDIGRNAAGDITALRCTVCGRLRRVNAFFKASPSNGAKHGRRMPCKKCRRPLHAAAEHRRRTDPTHREAAYEAARRWSQAHPEYERARSQRRWRTEPVYRARVKAAKARWAVEHPEYYRTAAKLRRAKLRGVVCELTPEQWTAVLNAHGNACVYCGDSHKLTMDHLVPISRGGNHTIDNVVPSCKSCNSSKHDRTLDEFFERRGGKVEFCKRRTLGLFRLRTEAVTRCL